jgi:hypothetical protein
MFVRAYLRASTKEQDPYRAKADLDRFAKERGLKIAAYYRENESGGPVSSGPNCSSYCLIASPRTCYWSNRSIGSPVLAPSIGTS